MWFRRDLRWRDHPALAAAVAAARRNGGQVLPVFILDPTLLGPAGPNRLAYLYACLRSLIADGVPLMLARGEPADVIAGLARAIGSPTVFVSADFGPYGRRRDAQVRSALAGCGSELVEVESPYVVPPGTVRKGDGSPFKVFTPFSKVWLAEAAGVRPADATFPASIPWIRRRPEGPTLQPVCAVPEDPPGVGARLPQAGEVAAGRRLDHFLTEGADRYDTVRDLPGLDATSRLSPDLKYGVVHPRQILARLDADHRAHGVVRNELAWREFYADVLWHRPDSARADWNPTLTAMPVDEGVEADQRFAAWCEGRTGYPFVDAGMRQLLAEGWMHNRVRMVTASFLVKDLHLDWRRGAHHFLRHLVDGDLASNQHGWQWTAGTGTDAAPYFRIFNPTAQGQRFDPEGQYIRRYVPELAHLAAAEVHEPARAGLFGAVGYPPPIVNHAAERVESLSRYRALRTGER